MISFLQETPREAREVFWFLSQLRAGEKVLLQIKERIE